jgi:beta-lactamase superfamily II metal-dependent hydrolase
MGMTDIVFCVHVLPAGNGDALVVDYGQAGRVQRALIDGGVPTAGPVVKGFLGGDANLELLVVTHIDNDHVGGILTLLGGSEPPTPEEVWFNGFRHLPDSPLESMGPVQGEALTALIVEREYKWNTMFDGRAVARDEDAALLPVHTLPGGLQCTVLSPGPDELYQLRIGTTWAEIVQEAGLDPQTPLLETEVEPADGCLAPMGAFDIDALADEVTPNDNTPANGSSIALLVEYAERKCLLAGDAHPDVLIAGVDRLVGRGNVLQVDVFKLPHHGSKANVTRELLSRIRAHTYVFSTDGSGNQRHPNDQAVARTLKYGGPSPVLAFNYRSARNELWDSDWRKSEYGYQAIYPPQGTAGISLDLVAIER